MYIPLWLIIVIGVIIGVLLAKIVQLIFQNEELRKVIYHLEGINVSTSEKEGDAEGM